MSLYVSVCTCVSDVCAYVCMCGQMYVRVHVIFISVCVCVYIYVCAECVCGNVC